MKAQKLSVKLSVNFDKSVNKAIMPLSANTG